MWLSGVLAYHPQHCTINFPREAKKKKKDREVTSVITVVSTLSFLVSQSFVITFIGKILGGVERKMEVFNVVKVLTQPNHSCHKLAFWFKGFCLFRSSGP